MKKDDIIEFDMNEAENIFECAHFDLNDEILNKAKIASYMFG